MSARVLTRRRFGGVAAAGLVSSACVESSVASPPQSGTASKVPATESEPAVNPRAAVEHQVPPFTPLVPKARLLSRTPVSVEDSPDLAPWIERAPALRDVRVSTLEYDSDGVEVSAHLVAPADAEAAPTVVYARGGGRLNQVTPFVVATHIAPLAAAGYCVIATRYRSEPNGRDEFGGADVADLVNVVGLLEQLPEADPARVGLLGWSRGAMMVHLALAHAPGPFRAAVCAAGVADSFAELKRRPEMEGVFARHIPSFEDHRDREVARRSPILWADRLPRDVPILLLHGGADWRVSPHESLRLAGRFLDLAIPHRLVLYEGGEHGISEHAEDVRGQIVSWFQRYLVVDAALPNVEPHGR